MAWCSDDEYCDRVWQRYQRALKLIEKYKDSPVEDINFLANYCENVLNDYFKEEDRATKEWKRGNKLEYQINKLKQHIKDLEKTFIVNAKDKELANKRIEFLRGKYEQ